MISFRSRRWLSAVVGLWIAHPLTAQEPSRLYLPPLPAPVAASDRSANQRVAETIADYLRQNGQLRHYSIDIAYCNGIVEISGSVVDSSQRDEVLRIVHGVPEVRQVIDRLTLSRNQAIMPVQGVPPLPLREPGTSPAMPSEPNIGKDPLTPSEPNVGKDPLPLPPAGPSGNTGTSPGNGNIREPMPIFQAPPPAPYDVNPPRMPPYAWPTYAPYNNYSRVAYPTAYPYQSWPYIGPFYPFPKVPLGWRSVKLQWEDGYWWFKKNATGSDWWHLRYW